MLRHWPLLLLLLTPPAAATPTAEEQLAAFEKAQAQRRAELGLGDRELRRRYPPPRLRFKHATHFAPGLPVTLKVPGEVPAGAAFAFSCPGIVIRQQRRLPDGVELRLGLPRYLNQSACFLDVISPVSSAASRFRALELSALYQWHLSLSNGMRVEADVESGYTSSNTRVRWRVGAAWVERGLPVGAPYPYEAWLKVGRTAEDEAASARAWEASGEPARREQVWRQLVSAPTSEQRALLQSLSELEHRERALFRRHPVVCDELALRIDDDWRISGTAHGCAGTDGVVTVTGRVEVKLR